MLQQHIKNPESAHLSQTRCVWKVDEKEVHDENMTVYFK